MPIKEEDQDIIIRWKGGKIRMSFRGHLPTEGLCTYVMLC